MEPVKLSKVVQVDPMMRLHDVTYDTAKMYDSEAMFNVVRGDIVMTKLPEGVRSYIVTDVERANLADYGDTLNLVSLNLIQPPKEKPMFEEEYATAKWRVGRTVGRTIYAMRGAEASETDALIGMMDTPALAKAAVESHNKIHFPDEALWAERV